MQKVCETIGLFNAEGQCKPSAERSLLQLCRGAACPRPTGQYTAFPERSSREAALFFYDIHSHEH